MRNFVTFDIYTEVKLGDILVVVLSNDPRSKTKKWGNPDFTYLNNLYTWNSQIVTLRKYVAEGMILRINVTIHTNAYPPDYTIIRKNYSVEEWAKLIKADKGGASRTGDLRTCMQKREDLEVTGRGVFGLITKWWKSVLVALGWNKKYLWPFVLWFVTILEFRLSNLSVLKYVY